MAVEVKHFEQRTEPIPFSIGTRDDVYYAAPELPGGYLGDLVMRYEDAKSQTDAKKQLDMLFDLLESLLLDEGAERFKGRLNDKTNPVGMRALMALFNWLFEQYGMRPTEPSPDSPGGADDGTSGTLSTESARSEESILESSASLGTSTLSTPSSPTD